jgi:hypothetical protein
MATEASISEILRFLFSRLQTSAIRAAIRDGLRIISPRYQRCPLPDPTHSGPHKPNLPPLRRRIRRHQRAYRIEYGLKLGDLLPRQRGPLPRQGFVRPQQLPQADKGPHAPDIHLNRPLRAARVGVVALRRPACGPRVAGRFRNQIPLGPPLSKGEIRKIARGQPSTHRRANSSKIAIRSPP